MRLSDLAGGGLKAQLIRGGLGSLGVRILQAGLGFMVSIALARLLGAAGMGDYASTVAIATLLVIPIQAGVARQVNRGVAASDAGGDWPALLGLFVWANRTALVFSALIALGVGIYHFSAPAGWPSSLLLLAALPLVPIVAATSLHVAVLSGLQKVVVGQLYEPIRNAVFLIILIMLGWIGAAVTPVSVTFVFAGCCAISLVHVVIAVHRRLPEACKDAAPVLESRLWLKASLPLLLVGGISTISSKIDVVLVRGLSGDVEAGLYQVASQFSALILFGLTAVTLTVTPHFTRLHHQGDTARLQLLATRSAQASLAFALFATAVLGLLGQPTLGFLFGPEFMPAWSTLMVLSLGLVIQASTGASAALLTMTGHEGATLRAALLALAIKIVLGSALIPAFGASGAALSLVASMLALNIACWRAAHSRLGVETFAVARLRRI